MGDGRDESGASEARSPQRPDMGGSLRPGPVSPQTGLAVHHIKSRGSKVRQGTDLHLTLQLEMVISRCNDDPWMTVRDENKRR